METVIHRVDLHNRLPYTEDVYGNLFLFKMPYLTNFIEKTQNMWYNMTEQDKKTVKVGYGNEERIKI